MATTKTTPGAGNALTHRVGPFPVWLWGLLAVGAYLVFFRKKAAASTTASTGTVTSAPQTETITYPTGSSYSGPVGYAPGGGGGGGTGGGSAGSSVPGSPIPTPGNSTATPGGGNAGITGGTVTGGGNLFQMGSGYSIQRTGKLSSGSVYGSTGGLYSTIASYTTTVRMLDSGAPVYYQPSPGVFRQVTSTQQLSQIEPTGAKGGRTDTTTYTKG